MILPVSFSAPHTFLPYSVTHVSKKHPVHVNRMFSSFVELLGEKGILTQEE